MKMYLSIGEVSKLFNLNKQTLHFYDKENLFVPQYRDEKTGYRKYAFEQIYSLALICYLRKIGFSIEQIKSYMNLRNVDLTIKKLKEQSETLREQYKVIINTDNVIQRKIYFVEQKLKTMDTNSVSRKYYPKRAYVPLGAEDTLYNNETFYFYPTIAFYNYDETQQKYNITFGAYIDSTVDIPEEFSDKIRYIDEQEFLCFFCQGNYKNIYKKIEQIRNEYSHLNLSMNTFNFNIVDQFLEKNMDDYITEVQIPIIKD
ncbi:MAG: MerR family transcriptional regulator [Oscillospiraceae bacterium]